jgi:cytochrome c peroxidase
MTRTGKSLVLALALCASALIPAVLASGKSDGTLDGDLASVLSAAGFTGQIEQTFQTRLQENLGRPIDPKLADLGRMLWFDTRHSLHQDNTCGGCHSPSNGFGDSQPMAIGVQNNGVVGPHRAGPRNPRRSPLVINRRCIQR